MLQFPLSIAQNKAEIRKFCKEIRKQLFIDGKSDRISTRIVNNIQSFEYFIKAENVMIFHPLKEEINLLSLLCTKGKNFYFPKCTENNIVVCPHKEDRFECGKYNIMEPKTKPLKNLSSLDIIFVPALCADLNFNRLGYGGGFYDRFFKNSEIKAKKAVVVANKLIAQNLPSDVYDVKMDFIVTEDKIFVKN